MDTIEGIIARVVTTLDTVPCVLALVLGGSRATGTHTDASDIDIGLYYDAATFDLAGLRTAVSAIDDQRRIDAVTAPGAWGAWVDGGGWLKVDGHAVDIIYRDLERVRRSVDEAVLGQFTVYSHWGHPHGVPNILYAAELAHCHILWQREDAISALKPRIHPYPPLLRERITTTMLDEAKFFAMVARHGLPRHDVSYTSGCAFRSIACLMQALFAHNSQWLLNEKGAVAAASRLPMTIPELEKEVASIYAALGREDLKSGVAQLEQLESTIRALIATPQVQSLQ